MSIKTANYVRIVEAEGLPENLTKGMIGCVNNVIEIEDCEYIFFMPTDEFKSYVFTSDRVEVLSDEEVAALELENPLAA